VQVVDQQQAQPDILHRSISLAAELGEGGTAAGFSAERLQDG
jgi:hypothetical protein